MTEDVKKIRNDIIKKFCRTVLWIDDEINLDKGLAAEGTNPLFKNKYNEFTKARLLCHMMGFPEVRSDSDPYASNTELEEALRSCASLALQSDVVIVDWMLGTTESSKYAQEIIKGIVGRDKGFRFIVVLSNKATADSEFTQMDPSFKIHGSSDLWKNESGQFLLSLHKNVFNDASLFEKICDTLLDVYPDYLHLAAVEIAGRIKDFAPRWFSALPSNTDMGILTERANLMCARDTKETWRDDIQECIVANLLEDLTTLILGEPLNALGENSLRPSNVISDLLSKLLESSVAADVKSVLNQVKPCFEDEPQSALKPGQYKQLAKHRDILSISNFLKGIEAYTEFCETKSLNGSSICPGAVYSGIFTGSDDIAVCISAACDCVRADALLFLRGERMKDSSGGTNDVSDYNTLPSTTGGKTVLRFQEQAYIFRHEANSLTAKSRGELAPPIRQIGTFRSNILDRLVSRFMSHLRRVGVNQPTLSRKLRKEVSSDEE